MPNGQGYTIGVDGVLSTDFPYLICEKVTRSLVGKDRKVAREIAGREGAWLFGEKRGLRTIRLEMAIVSDNFPVARREDLVEVADWVDTEGWCRLSISDEPGKFYKAYLSGEPDIDEWRELGRFELEFMAEPYAYDDEVTLSEFNVTDFGIPAGVYVDDKVPVYPIISLAPQSGNFEGFTVSVGDYSLTYEAEVVSGELITISSLAFVVVEGGNSDLECEGTYDPGTLDMVDVSGTFPIFAEEGFNYLLITPLNFSTATSALVEVTWRRRYR